MSLSYAPRGFGMIHNAIEPSEAPRSFQGTNDALKMISSLTG
jgi:hypothetical protein